MPFSRPTTAESCAYGPAAAVKFLKTMWPNDVVIIIQTDTDVKIYNLQEALLSASVAVVVVIFLSASKWGKTVSVIFCNLMC